MSISGDRWFHPAGRLRADDWDVLVEPTASDWSYAGLRIARFDGEGSRELSAGPIERLFVPLAGSFSVEHEEGAGRRIHTDLHGRSSVFSGPTDVLYLPAGAAAVMTGSGRLAVAEAPATKVRPWRLIDADDVPVEVRGGGSASRQVHNFGIPGVLDAARLIVCEVITPAGNWSSYPPHKHDEDVPGRETSLEEIYYFEAAPVGGGSGRPNAAFGLFSAHSSPTGRIDLDTRVRTGDVALVPYGYHGPAVAAPGYDLYYLNVMAGPGPERAWRIIDDPHHAWIRELWAAEGADPRLPFPRKEHR